MPDPQQQIARRGGGLGDQLALACPAPEDHHLFELRLHRPVDAQAVEVAREPPDQFGIEHVAGHDEDEHAAVLQQGQGALVEELLQARSALALVADVAVGILGQIAVGRVEPEQAEGLAGDHRVHQVAVQAVVHQRTRVGRALAVVLDGIRGDLRAPEGVGRLGDRHAFAGAGIEDAHRTAVGREGGQHPRERRLVGGEVAGLDEIAREARKHECHGMLLVR